MKNTDNPSNNSSNNPNRQLRYLALGDSYTIGEKVRAEDNFPHQFTRMLYDSGLACNEPTIVAKTGWTTDELENGIAQRDLNSTYDIVTLLIGVNDQYRGRTVEDYKPRFENLLKKALQFAGNDKKRLVVLSIPDWGVTPYAEGRDRAQIAREIDAYNAANKLITETYGVTYLSITESTRRAANDLTLLAEDGLHPSGKEYKVWAQGLSGIFTPRLK